MVNWSSRSHRTNCCGLYNYLWFGALLVRQKPASSLVWHFPFWRIRLCSFYRRLSECEFVSCSCRRLCLHRLQLEDVPQFLAIKAFFLCMILTGAGYSRLPTFQVTGGFLCAPKSSASFRFCHHFECALLNTIVKLSHKVVLLNMVLGVFC